MIRKTKEIDMETMLKFRCDGCDKEFIVMDHQVDTDALACPHCQEEIEVPEIDDEEDDSCPYGGEDNDAYASRRRPGHVQVRSGTVSRVRSAGYGE